MNAAQSLLFEPVLWEGDGFRILDEIQLPDKIEFIEVSHVEQAVDAVRTMKTRAFGQVLTFLYAGALLSQRHATEDARELGQRLKINSMPRTMATNVVATSAPRSVKR